MNVLVRNRQRAVALDLEALAAFAHRAAEICRLEGVEISLVSDRRIAALHAKFLHVRGATDVITFEHGEIVISAAAAVRAAREHGETLDRELGRYIVHGLLHLRGYDDTTPAARTIMWHTQERILRRLWTRDCAAQTNVRKRVPRR
jgi:probable rRNA maturation factor